MPEPTSTAAGVVTIAVGAAGTSALTLLGVNLGLRLDLLFAGFNGGLVAIILLNSVPGGSDTWQDLLRTSWRRLAVAVASSFTAGYLAPLVLLIASLPDSLLLGAAFGVGAGAQQVLTGAIKRLSGVKQPDDPPKGAAP